MTKKQLKEIAKIYAAGVVYNSMDCGADSELLSDDELDFMQKEVKNIGSKIHPLFDQFGELDSIIKHVIKLPK